MIVPDKEVEGYARDCVWLAELTDDPEIREQLFQMAREWMAAAMHEERLPERKLPLSLGGSRRLGPAKRGLLPPRGNSPEVCSMRSSK
jgi:hypothetical protein